MYIPNNLGCEKIKSKINNNDLCLYFYLLFCFMIYTNNYEIK